MLDKFKPLLAENFELEKLRFPLLVSPKLDGIRCIIHPELGPVTRSLKPIPNKHIRDTLAAKALVGWDGELITYSPERDDFNTVQSKVMSEDGEPDFLFHVFDNMLFPNKRFDDRLWCLEDEIGESDLNFFELVVHEYAHTLEDLMIIEQANVNLGYEGTMLRDPAGIYKFGRSTVNEGILLKMKRFHDDEAIIVGAVELQHNGNEKTRDELGYAKRSSAKAGKTASGTLGALELEWVQNGKKVRFEVGTGFTDQQRKSYWMKRDDILGLHVKFKHQEVLPSGKPRIPVFIGFRPAEDLDTLF